MPEYMQLGPMTFEVSTAVTAGQAVMPDGTTGKIKPTTGAVANALGVARDDAAPEGSGTATNFATLRPEVAVFSAPYVVKAKFAADCAFGQKVVTAADGQVTPVGAAAASDGTQVFAVCVEAAGVTSGDVGRIKMV
jgi:hypothetical protein